MLPVKREAHRGRPDAAAHVEVPERLAGIGIHREDVALLGPGDHEPAGGGQYPGHCGRQLLELPLQLSGQGVERPDRSVGLIRVRPPLAAADESRSGLVLGLALEVDGGHLPGRDEERHPVRVVGRAVPVRRAGKARPHQRPLLARRRPGNAHGPAVLVDPLRPGLGRVLGRPQELARLAVEHVVERVAVREDDQLPHRAVPLGVHQHRDLVGVPVVDVVRGVLEVPAHFAGVHVECDQRVGIEVVAGPGIAVPVRGRIPGRPVEEAEFGVIGAGQPGSPSSRLPTVAAPGVVARFPFGGDGPPTPDPFAGLRVVGVEESADAGLAAADPHDDLAVHRERRRRHRVADRVVGDRDFPADVTVRSIQRDQLGVERSEKHRVAEDRDPPVRPREADVQRLFGDDRVVAPQPPAGVGVERGDRARGLGDVHHAVGHQRRHLDPADSPGLVDPRRPQPGDVLLGDLIEPAEPLRAVVAGIHEPGLGLVVGVQEARIGHLRQGRGRDQSDEGKGPQESQTGHSGSPSGPRRVAR